MNKILKWDSRIKDYEVPRISVMEMDCSGCLCTSDVNFSEKEGIEETLYGDPVHF